ncbi:MAG: WYL domain-containing protein [Actinomycetaceae bacterium]|nr:WYL domain-containing protein [Actinomycetaceae bacterium]MDY6143652.1 WYL domain-containing protein [Arcanobacterium sp.]
MRSGEDSSAGERQLALYVMLLSGRVTREQVYGLPAYRRYADAGTMRERFRTDLESLRASGHVIDYDETADAYSLNTDRAITVTGTRFDLALLNSILIPKETAGPEFLAQEGLTKLLAAMPSFSNADAAVHPVLPISDTRPGASYTRRTDFLTTAANAIQMRRRIRMSYTPADSDAPREYLIEPWALDVYYGFFYMTGMKIDADSQQPLGERRFKLVRIDSIDMLDEPNVYPIETEDNSAMPRVLPQVVLSVRDGTCAPLIARSSSTPIPKEAENLIRPGDVGVALRGADSRNLYDDLMFYGSDVLIVYPPEVRAEFTDLLHSIVSLPKNAVASDSDVCDRGRAAYSGVDARGLNEN